MQDEQPDMIAICKSTNADACYICMAKPLWATLSHSTAVEISSACELEPQNWLSCFSQAEPLQHQEQASETTACGCKGNLTIKHNTQILARGIQSTLDKYNTAEGCIPCKGDPKRKL